MTIDDIAEEVLRFYGYDKVGETMDAHSGILTRNHRLFNNLALLTAYKAVSYLLKA